MLDQINSHKLCVCASLRLRTSIAPLEDGALTLNIDGLDIEVTLLHAHLGCEGGGRPPLGGGTRGSLLHHLIDLLEGQTLGLRDEEEGVDEGAGAEATPDEENAGAEVALIGVDHVGSDDGNDTGAMLALPAGMTRRVATYVFHSQLEEVERATPRERIGRGKISPMTIQAPGPQVEAKKKMKMAMKAI